jgi:MFS transporter, FSR family, fosmidomycin resistance protein
MTMSAVATPFRQDAGIISMVGFAHGTSHFFHLMFPPLFPWIMADFGLGYAEVGLLMTVFFVVSGIGQALAGFLVDRFGAHRVLCAGIAVLSASGLVVAIAPNFPVLLIAAVLAGLGNCVFHPADYALLNRRVSHARLGHAFSVHGLSGNLGWAAGAVVMTATASAWGWHAAGIAAALVGMTSLAALWWQRDLLADELGERSARRAQAGSTGWGFVRVSMVWLAFAFFFFSTLAFGALQNFAPTLLHDLYALSLAAGTSALTAYLLGGSMGLAVGGFFAGGERKQERLVAAAFMSSASLAFLLAAAIAPGWSVIAIMAVMGFGVGLAGPSRDMLVRNATAARLGTGAFGRVYGFVYSGLDVGLASAPILFGLLLDANLPRLVFVGVGGSLLLAIVAAVALGRRGK